MKLNSWQKRLVMSCTSFFPLVLNCALFAYIWYRWYHLALGMPFYRKGSWLVIAIYALLSFTFTNVYGGYKIGYLKRGDVIYSAILSALFVNAVTYLQISLLGRRFLSLAPMLWLMLWQCILLLLWATLADRLYHRLYKPHRTLVIYGSYGAESLVEKMKTRPDRYHIAGMLSIDEGLETIYSHMPSYDAVIICDVDAKARNELLKYCFAHSVRTYLTTKISDTIVRGADKIHLFDTPLLLCRNTGLTFEQRTVKRACDLVLAVLACIPALPLMGAIALAIRLYDAGPVLYRQKRLTKDGKVFSLYKFRSMVVDAEKQSGACLASQNDARITPVGRWLRRLRLDELPQLFNILKGDMSLVGPRPERPEMALQYMQTLPEFGFRLKVKAGLTGYAQVLGKYNTTPYDKLKLDLMYIEQYSLLLDLQLILMTIKILFLPSSTEGVTQAPTPAASDASTNKREETPSATKK